MRQRSCADSMSLNAIARPAAAYIVPSMLQMTRRHACMTPANLRAPSSQRGQGSRGYAARPRLETMYCMRSETFYSTVAQMLPTLLVALAAAFVAIRQAVQMAGEAPSPEELERRYASDNPPINVPVIMTALVGMLAWDCPALTDRADNSVRLHS